MLGVEVGNLIDILIIDASTDTHQVLTTILSPDPEFNVVGIVSDPQLTNEQIERTAPDVLILDLGTPQSDGLRTLETIISYCSIPIILISRMSREGIEAIIQGLEMGAIDFIDRPSVDMKRGFQNIVTNITEKVKCAASANVRYSVSVREVLNDFPPYGEVYSPDTHIIGIGASTGGVIAIQEILKRMPEDSPAIIFVQDMPTEFSEYFVRRLNATSNMPVVEVKHNQPVVPGQVYVAPGGHHLRVVRDGAGYTCKLAMDQPVFGRRPSIDVLFNSLALSTAGHAVGVILTGKGADGVDGLLAMRRAGALTIGQDEQSSAVFETPKRALEKGACAMEIAVEEIAPTIIQHCCYVESS